MITLIEKESKLVKDITKTLDTYLPNRYKWDSEVLWYYGNYFKNKTLPIAYSDLVIDSDAKFSYVIPSDYMGDMTLKKQQLEFRITKLKEFKDLLPNLLKNLK